MLRSSGSSAGRRIREAGRWDAGWRGVHHDVALQAFEQRLTRAARRAAAALRSAEDELELPRVPPPGAEQGVDRSGAARVLSPPEDRPRLGGQRRPEDGRGVQEEEVDIPRVRECLEHEAVGGGHAGEAEAGQPLGQRDEAGILTQARRRRRQPLGRARGADPLPQRSPQRGLPAEPLGQRSRHPVLVAAGGPRGDQGRALAAIAGEQVCQVPHHGQPPAAAELVRLGVEADVPGQRGEPRLPGELLHDLEQGPGQPLGGPRVGVRVDARRGGECRSEQRPGRGELHPGADPVAAAGTGSERGGQPLGEPALHAAGGHRHDLRRERVLRWSGQPPGEGVGEEIGSVGAVEVEHRGGDLTYVAPRRPELTSTPPRMRARAPVPAPALAPALRPWGGAAARRGSRHRRRSTPR